MRRLLGSLAIVLLAASATIGSAATLRAPDSRIAAATATVARCDTDGVGVTYRLRPAAPLAIDRISITGIADRCVGLTLTIVLVGAGTSLEIGSAAIEATTTDDNRLDFDLDVPIAATAVDVANILIA